MILAFAGVLLFFAALGTYADPNMLKLREKARRVCAGNNQATEAVWQTLCDLLKGLLTFCAYLMVLSSDRYGANHLRRRVLINKRINEWGYRHREEQALYEKKMEYVGNKSENIKLAKDVRLFGMKVWLEDLYRASVWLTSLAGAVFQKRDLFNVPCPHRKK